MPNIEWLLHAATDRRALRVETRTAVSDADWTGTIERLELDAGLRIYLVAADVARDMVLEPRNTALSPLFASQLSVSGDVGIVFPDGVTTRFSPERAIFFRPTVNVARFGLRGGQRVKAAGYAFETDRLLRLFDGRLPEPLRPLVETHRDLTQVVDMAATARMRRLAEALFAPDLNGPLRILYMEGVVLQLLAIQAAAAESRRRTPLRLSLSEPERAKVLEARDRLLADMRSPPTLGALAFAVGLTERRLSAGFRAVFGMSAYELLRDARLEHARLALETEAVVLKEIAYRVGYNHATNFINAFTARFGVSPRRWADREARPADPEEA